jgi:hypothetical protein
LTTRWLQIFCNHEELLLISIVLSIENTFDGYFSRSPEDGPSHYWYQDHWWIIRCHLFQHLPSLVLCAAPFLRFELSDLKKMLLAAYLSINLKFSEKNFRNFCWKLFSISTKNISSLWIILLDSKHIEDFTYVSRRTLTSETYRILWF